MFIPLVIFASVLIALARGGQLRNLAALPVRYVGLLFVPLVIQLVAFSPLGDLFVGGTPLAQYLYAASLGVAVLALALNRRLPGITWIALGLFLNFLVITVNGGFMPVSSAAREIAGMAALSVRDMNVVPMTNATVLPWLADILPLPAFIPFANVFSLGDLLIVIGGVIFTQKSIVRSEAQVGPPSDS